MWIAGAVLLIVVMLLTLGFVFKKIKELD